MHSRQSFTEVQLDAVSPTARTLLPLIGRELFYTEGAAPADTQTGRRREALDILAEWSGEMNEHLAAPMIYAAWVRALQTRLIADELGAPLAAEFNHVAPLFLERVYRDIDGAAAWCDVVRSQAQENCAQTASMALNDALTWLAETYSGDLASLHWGDAHVAHHDHDALGDIPVLSWLVNIRQSTSRGDFTLRRGITDGRMPNPFANTCAAGYRSVIDMADPDNSAFIIATGQSGHPLSRLYGNLARTWQRGAYIPMSLDRDLARAGAIRVTTPRPPQAG